MSNKPVHTKLLIKQGFRVLSLDARACWRKTLYSVYFGCACFFSESGSSRIIHAQLTLNF